MKAVAVLRKHENHMFGEVTDIAPRSYGSDQVPKTPEKDNERDELPWYWKLRNNESQPRTPTEAIRRHQK